jgi:uncharacterized lipoprotein YmbA
VRATAFGSLLLVVVAALGTAACIGGRASPATRHHVLSPAIEAPPRDGASAVTATRVIGVGPVTVPAYLDRPQIVMRPAPDTIAVMEFEQWGEPLRDGVMRVLAVNLARLLPDSLVVVFPWRSTEKVRYQVIVEIAQMDGPAGSIALDARWRVADPSGSEVAARVSRVTESAGSGTAAAAVSRALGALSREIARELMGAAIRAADGARP